MPNALSASVTVVLSKILLSIFCMLNATDDIGLKEYSPHSLPEVSLRFELILYIPSLATPLPALYPPVASIGASVSDLVTDKLK